MTDPAAVARALELFEHLLELAPAEREAVLIEECADDPDVLAIVERLLDADARPGRERLEAESLAMRVPPDREDDPSEPTGRRIGPYRILREAGRGGMATVYLAERDVGGARQRVALKLVRRGIDTDDVIHRFVHETRVLASLQHPNIARFYDAGASEDGRPYLVMEFVEGEPITRYCDAERMSVAGRLELFKDVCDGVQFAHQRLVVHRDIKPSNVLVGGDGRAKLLDFGIAKLLADDDSDLAVPVTRTGMRILTPEYASPEQLRGDPISTATDVYALGLVLYEMLTGRRARESGTGDTDDGTFEPIPPSTLVRRSEGNEEVGLIAAARSTTAERLRRRLQGDLDRITLKALDPDPARRYPSAQQLRDDVQRHLSGLPVEARPSTIRYRIQKFARRHRAGLTAAAAAALLLAGFSAFYAIRITGERDVARTEAAKARATTLFLQRLLGDAYPSVALGDSFSMGDLLRRAAARVDSLDAEPEVQAEILRTLGDVYREQGRFDDALPLLERAIAIHEASEEPVSRAAGQALDALGHLQYERRDFEAAASAHRRSLETFERLFAPDDSLVLFALNNVAAAVTELGDYEEARRLYDVILSRRARLFADTSQLVHVVWNNLGQLDYAMRDFVAAERDFREALRLRRMALPADHPSVALTLNNLATTLTALDRLEEAEEAHREALEMFRRVYGPDHHRVGLVAYNLASVLRRMERYDEAEPLLRTTLAIDRKTYGPRHLEIGVDLRGLGLLQVEKGDCPAAVETLREADAIFAEHEVPLTHRRRLSARSRIGRCLTELGQYEAAEEVLLESFRAAQAAPGESDSTSVRETIDGLIDLYTTLGRPEAAATIRESAVARDPGGP